MPWVLFISTYLETQENKSIVENDFIFLKTDPILISFPFNAGRREAYVKIYVQTDISVEI